MTNNNAVKAEVQLVYISERSASTDEAAIVDALYASICRDPRHHNARLLLRKPIQQRDFSHWNSNRFESKIATMVAG